MNLEACLSSQRLGWGEGIPRASWLGILAKAASSRLKCEYNAEERRHDPLTPQACTHTHAQPHTSERTPHTWKIPYDCPFLFLFLPAIHLSTTRHILQHSAIVWCVLSIMQVDQSQQDQTHASPPLWKPASGGRGRH